MTIQSSPVHQYTQGWPVDSGPLAALARLRLHNPSDGQPSWLRLPTVHVDTQGRTVYICRPRYMHQEGMRQLAALSFEGYLVGVEPSNKTELKIRLIVIGGNDA